jgi:hypothetical protein
MFTQFFFLALLYITCDLFHCNCHKVRLVRRPVTSYNLLTVTYLLFCNNKTICDSS